jgi:hypothetical protein
VFALTGTSVPMVLLCAPRRLRLEPAGSREQALYDNRHCGQAVGATTARLKPEKTQKGGPSCYCHTSQ